MILCNSKCWENSSKNLLMLSTWRKLRWMARYDLGDNVDHYTYWQTLIHINRVFAKKNCNIIHKTRYKSISRVFVYNF